ncbi:hypothetical protein CAPTEDRAFT_222950 [Capitella teleta]|uniref:THAP-type domain-containing protein n=1 Tax=Capitella teleta TaxID=283909 RepID=X2ATT0_CAPTE|nr:hypothetical protein CAPTEDRAFT_222950 [Capitella teleta]|eukprot:ELU04679.1 hypothetical protein CAPTEDRAFT_222950 [Capitella teleta]
MPKVPRSRLCLVAGCCNSIQKTVRPDAMFYPLPHEHAKRLRNWLKAISREHYSFPSRGFVCSRHFAPDAYCKGPRKILIGDNPPLRITALPSLFLGESTAAEVIALSDEECEILDITPKNDSISKKKRSRGNNHQKLGSSGGAEKKQDLAKGSNIAAIQTDLFMECQEENLSTAQVKAFKQAKEDYKNAQSAIKACLNGCSQSSEDIDLTTGIKTITVYFERPATPPPHSLISPTFQMNGADDDDVIVVNETIISRDKTRSRGNIQSIPLPHKSAYPESHAVLRGVLNAPPEIAPKAVMPKNITQKNAKSTSKVTAGTKRLAEPGAPPPAKKVAHQVDTSEMSWVPLEEFYYGKAEGNPLYTEDKGEYRFKEFQCYSCHKMLYSNLRAMKHVQGHIDSEKQQNLDLSDLTQCKHCYKQFDTPFEMQCHVEKVHQSKSNVLVCRICEKDHDTSSGLSYHMRTFHNPCEMPYVCQLCKFRSSVYNDVVDHFYKRHNNSKHMLCLYCLKIFAVNILSHGCGLTQYYFQHLQRHQAKSRVKKCSSCKLSFISQADLIAHKKTDHKKNNKALLASKYTPHNDQVMVQVSKRGVSQGMKSLNAPSLSKVLDMSQLQMHGVTKQHKCSECQAPMQSKDHYTKHVACSLCRYATTCNDSFANHMTGLHTGNAKVLKKITIKEKPSTEMFCSCGYSSRYGNQIANHLTLCATSKSTCSSSKLTKQQPKPSQALDTPSLFGALGLVKKSSSSRVARVQKQTTEDMIDKVLGRVSPVEDEVKTELDSDSQSPLRRPSISILSPIKDKQASIIGQVTIKEEEPEDMGNLSENLTSNDAERTAEESAVDGSEITNKAPVENGQESIQGQGTKDDGLSEMLCMNEGETEETSFNQTEPHTEK